MDQLQQFSGVGTVYRADGSPLSGERQYSITLVPWCEAERPLAIGSWVELRNQEALELETEQLRLRVHDGRWCTFTVTHVSETAPHQCTFVAQAWPQHDAHDQRVRHAS
jgi:hypothetical protein